MAEVLEEPGLEGGGRRFLRRRRSPVLRAFLKAPSGIIGLAAMLAIMFVGLLGPTVFGDDAKRIDLLHTTAQPSWDHLLGTDELGRDVLARLLVASQLSLKIGFGAALVAFGIGVPLGALAAVLGPRARPVMLRLIDTMISFPGILKALLVATIIGVGARSVVLGIGIAGSFGFARITSTLALSVGGRDYIQAAKVVGVRGPRLLFRYVIPNIAEPLIIFLGVAIGGAILAAAGLSFLGIGVQPPEVDWGRMLTEGVRRIYLTPAAALGPAIAMGITALSFALVAEAIARAMNPLLWTEKRDRPSVPVSDLAAGPLPDHGPEPSTAAEVARARTNGSSNGAALEVRDLVVSFLTPAGRVEVVKGVSFYAEPGEVLGIVGESGSGKTMTALSIAQLTPFPGRVSGTVKLNGTDLGTLSKQQLDKLLATSLAVVYQDPLSALNPALSVGKQLTEGVRAYAGMTKKQANTLAADRLRETHIPAAERQLRRFPHEFSGGMRQRAMIAMGLMTEPSLIVADEPTTALDVSIQAQIMDLLGEVNQTHRTAIVLISHNLALISQNCHRVLVMYCGRIVEDLDVAQLRTDPQHPYTRGLLGAIPEIGQDRSAPLSQIPGDPADVAAPPPGCAYHPRCPLAVERCRVERPLLLTRAGERGRRVACHVANDGAEIKQPDTAA